ncbi:MAG: VanZ family protein [Rhodospirillales bacterium]|nr:VanZ family protein [Rhodospirillales bacterium]
MIGRTNTLAIWIRYGARAGFVVALLAVIYLSVAPQTTSAFPDVSDKIQHAFAYFVLTMLGLLSFPQQKALAVLAVALIVLGCGLEGVQAMVPGRVPAGSDIVANTAGVLIGLLLAAIARRLLFSARACDKRLAQGAGK